MSLHPNTRRSVDAYPDFQSVTQTHRLSAGGCLVVYAALERRIREALRANKATFVDQKGKRTSNPTARWVFQFFAGIHLLIVERVGELVLNLKELHIELLKMLGENYERLYSGCS